MAEIAEFGGPPPRYRVEVKDNPMTPDRPYFVQVNGWTLVDKRGRTRRFQCSIRAALAGTRKVDELKRAAANKTAARIVCEHEPSQCVRDYCVRAGECERDNPRTT